MRKNILFFVSAYKNGDKLRMTSAVDSIFNCNGTGYLSKVVVHSIFKDITDV